jgi:hypothetical protein
MRTYTTPTRVKGGFYLNRDDWTMFVAPAEGAELPGNPGARHLRFPTVAMLVAAPVLSMAFVVFLPFIGIAMVARAGVDAAARALTTARAARRAEEAKAHK